ncbi:MAG: phosphoglycerate mutase [Comamonadaceae bacterium]|nr:phosphoglycerate mutase [Comamonadaceae bacterium]
MHLLIPYATCLSEPCLAAQPTLKLPHLEQLLKKLGPLDATGGDEFSLSPPHERALARALGLPAIDGQIAWAALQARQQLASATVDTAGTAWAFVTLCHWQVNTHHVAMSQLPLPGLSMEASAGLMAAMRLYFAEDGITLHADQPGRWLAQGEIFANLATASTDRVVGRNLEPWMPNTQQAAPLRRLQNEMQMLLYTHPVNDDRAQRGLPPVNSLWFSGTGALPAGYQTPSAQSQPGVIDALQQAALSDNWPAWTQAWQDIDATHIKSLLQRVGQGQPVQLTLCGERGSKSWHSYKATVWQKILSHLASKPLYSLLEAL